MIAIVTKYHGPTNTRGSRITAKRGDWRKGDPIVTIPYPHELSGEDCYRAAADAFCVRMATIGGEHWLNPIVGGGVDGGYVFCFVGGAK